MQVQDLVGIVPWTFVATILNLFIQVYLIKRFLFKPINEILEKRKAHADAEIQDATKAKEEAQAMKAEYEENMQNAKNKASEILTTAQRTAAIQSEEMLREASRQAAALKQRPKLTSFRRNARPSTNSRMRSAAWPWRSPAKSSNGK